MEFCICTDFADRERLKYLKKLGYTCIEPILFKFAELSESEAKDFKAFIDGEGLKCVSFNCMFPGGFHLYADGYDEKKIVEYAENAYYKAALSGTKIVTLGSGGARAVPDGMTHDEAFEKLGATLRNILAPIAKKNGLSICIEPLRTCETNFLNNARDLLRIVKESGCDNVGITLDYFQSYFGGDTSADIIACGKSLLHTHLASVKHNRAYPVNDDVEDFKKFFDALKVIGYEGALSLECTAGLTGKDFEEEAKVAFDCTKKALED